MEYKNKNGKVAGREIKSKKTELAEKEGCSFICVMENNVPKKIFVNKGGNMWKLIDEFSGLLLSNQKLGSPKELMTVMDFINKMPKFDFFKEFEIIED